jgi:iron complex transport system ATP-binding protein
MTESALPMLDVQGLLIGHHGRALGEPLSLDLRAGEIVAVLGPNGCGKTTLFRTLLGLIPALGGRVSVDGQDLLALDREAIARRVAYVPQAHAGVFAYAVQDLVLMGRAVHVSSFSTPSQADREAAAEALQRLGIAHLAARPCTEISGGERQLALIARALAQRSPVIVMDEPTASLDFGNQRLVLREIEALKARGAAVLLSTHQPEHALRIADRVALMGQGRLQGFGTPAAVMSAAALAALYGVDADEVRRSVPGVAAAAAAAEPPDRIDFAAVYRAQFRHQRRLPKPASAWDGRARDYGRHSGKSGYVEGFLERLDLTGAQSLLDVGCGPGMLALPLARRLPTVVALDYSAAMLEQLRDKAGEQGLTNVQTIHRAWEDDWHDVPVCDLAIASRSTTVDDLDAALAKLQRHARLRAYLSYPSDASFVDLGIVDALGIEAPRVPDLTLLIGMLRRRGLQPRIDYLEMPSRLGGCRSFDEFAQRLVWSTGPFDEAARERLRRWYDADPARAARGGAPMRWAFVEWAVDGS